jgi:hypothetical protein
MAKDNHKTKGFKFLFLLFIGLLATISTGSVRALSERSMVEGGSFPQTTIFTSVSNHPSNNVPGYPMVHFNDFDSIYGSPNGNWIIKARLVTLTIGNPDAILVNGEVRLLEDSPAPWTGGTENVGLFYNDLGINNSGEWVFSVDTDASSTADHYIVHVSPTDVFTAIAKEGEPIPQLPGATWDDYLVSPVIATSGLTGWSADEIGGVPSTQDGILVFGNDILAQQNGAIPPGQVGNQAMQNFHRFFFISAGGNHWMVKGDLTGDQSMDDVAVVDGTVVVQEGVILPNSGYPNPVDKFDGVYMTPSGDWFVRGTNDISGHDWVYRNGVVIAERGMPIFEGATEIFDDSAYSVTFDLHTGDSFGNYVVGGVTDNPDLEANTVLVVNNEAVVVRQGDPIDLDNNGVFDENAYFDIFFSDDLFLDDNGNLYFLASIMNNSSINIGTGVFKYDLSSVLETPAVYLPLLSAKIRKIIRE